MRDRGSIAFNFKIVYNTLFFVFVYRLQCKVVFPHHLTNIVHLTAKQNKFTILKGIYLILIKYHHNHHINSFIHIQYITHGLHSILQWTDWRYFLYLISVSHHIWFVMVLCIIILFSSRSMQMEHLRPTCFYSYSLNENNIGAVSG